MRQFLFKALKLEEFCPALEPCPVVIPMPPPAPILGTIEYQQLRDLLPKQLTNEEGERWSVRFTNWDSRYKLTSKEEIQKFLEWDKTDERQYIANEYDCNRFAVSLWGRVGEWTPGICFGLMLTGMTTPNYHAMNWFLDNEKHLWTVEPQSDRTKIQNLETSKVYHYFI